MRAAGPHFVAIPFRADGSWPKFDEINGAKPLLMLSSTLTARNPDLGGHPEQVARYAAMVATHLSFSEGRTALVRLAAQIHDIGKIALPDRILCQRERLDQSDWSRICEHPGIGAHLATAAGHPEVGMWVLSHHERWDGLGYPNGLQGEDIPIEGRIIAVANAYDNMTSARGRVGAYSHEGALFELRRGGGSEFDPDLVEVLGEVLGPIGCA